MGSLTKAHKNDFLVELDDVMAGIDAGDDPRIAIARLNKQIVAYQSAGDDVPVRLMRLSKMLANECAAQSQGR